MAAGAMLLSSTSVVANSMRLSRSRPSNPIRPRPVLPRQEDRLRLENHRG